MNFHPDCNKAVTIFHLPSSGTKEYPASADVTTTAGFLPLDRKEQVLEGGSYRIEAELYLDDTVDIRVSDKVVIDSTVYYVKYIFTASFSTLHHKRCSLSTEQ